MRALWLLFILTPGFALANDKANLAAQLPYGLFGKPTEPRVEPIKPTAPSGGQCNPEVPPEFLAILGKMNEPVKETNVDLPPSPTESKPSPFAGMKRIELKPKASTKSETFDAVTEAYGITIYRGGGSTPSKQGTEENFGIKVYRGPPRPLKENSTSSR
jgi:hypothetical protein